MCVSTIGHLKDHFVAYLISVSCTWNDLPKYGTVCMYLGFYKAHFRNTSRAILLILSMLILLWNRFERRQSLKNAIELTPLRARNLVSEHPTQKRLTAVSRNRGGLRQMLT